MFIATFGFVAPFAEDGPAGDAAGRDLADHIATVLENGGFDPGKPGDMQYAWELWPTVSGHKIQTLIGHVGDLEAFPPRQWLITNDLRLGVLERLFRPSRIHAKIQALREISFTLHRALSRDPRFSHIRWHNAMNFDLPGSADREAPI
jgi:hypothetical protein